MALERISEFGPHPDPWIPGGPGPQPWRAAAAALGNQVPGRTLEAVFGPSPDPWRIIFASLAARHPAIWDVIGGGRFFGAEVALNPQPLPPRFAYLLSVARTVISRAELLQEIADATRREGEQQGIIIIVGGYLTRFVDDWCGTRFRPKWPFPGPPPLWFIKELAGIDLVVMATQFEQAASDTFNPELRQNLADASARLAQTGLARMQ